MSCILTFSTLFIGTLNNSKNDFPYWVESSLLIMLNLLICIYIGTNPKYNKDE